MICPYCSKELPENARFCHHCMTIIKERPLIPPIKRRNRKLIALISCLFSFFVITLSVLFLLQHLQSYTSPTASSSDTTLNSSSANADDANSPKIASLQWEYRQVDETEYYDYSVYEQYSSNDAIVICGFTGLTNDDQVIYVPEQIDGKYVVGLDTCESPTQGFFSGANTIEILYLPPSLCFIADHTLINNYGLTDIYYAGYKLHATAIVAIPDHGLTFHCSNKTVLTNYIGPDGYSTLNEICSTEPTRRYYNMTYKFWHDTEVYT